MPLAEAQSKSSGRIASGNQLALGDQAVVVGIYGVPGSGKTFLLNQLKEQLGNLAFAFFEGSEMIAKSVPGGLDAFHSLEQRAKYHWRQIAINSIRQECSQTGRVGVVTGHFMFWPEEEEAGQPVYTQSDLDTYTHFLYLEVPAGIIAQRRGQDTLRYRPHASTDHIARWQKSEIAQLRGLCRSQGILFSLVFPRPTLLDGALKLLRDFQYHNEVHNLSIAEKGVDDIVAAGEGRMKTMLVLDGDRTLAPVDTSFLYWDKLVGSQRLANSGPLKTLFSSEMGYSYAAFRQAVLLYEESADDQRFDAVCQDVASEVVVHPELLSLLKRASREDHVGAMIVSCGLRRVWEKVLRREDLSEKITVIAGGRIADDLVVTAEVKGVIVSRLQNHHKLYTWAFGDSPLDLKMLSMADQAVVVVGEEQTRSKNMDAALLKAIENSGFRARQALVPSNALPRLNTKQLPLIQLREPEILHSIFSLRHSQSSVSIVHATERNAARLLMTPMRDASVFGPPLMRSHYRVGQYLATEFLSSVIGVEEYPILHVQGHQTSGFRCLNEKKTLIVALMRGGEPMAWGVNDVCPLAMFVHASSPEDIKHQHLEGQLNIVLVDSVVNSGQTVVNFVKHILNLHATGRIVVIAGVVQESSVTHGGLIHALACHTNLNLIALRMSSNKFTGEGVTDTGNRLFNTMAIP